LIDLICLTLMSTVKIVHTDTLVAKMCRGKGLVGNMLTRLKNIFNSKKAVKKAGKTVSKVSEKDQATAKGEPYVRVVNVDLNEENPSDGFFELEWNKIFVDKLRENGYSGTTEEEIVDSWFTQLCRNIGDADDY